MTDKHYAIEFMFHLTGSGGSFDYDFVFTNSPPQGLKAHFRIEATAGISEAGNAGITIEDLITLSSGNNMCMGFGHFQANATTGGTVKLQWAQNISSAEDTKMLAGSWLRITLLD